MFSFLARFERAALPSEWSVAAQLEFCLGTQQTRQATEIYFKQSLATTMATMLMVQSRLVNNIGHGTVVAACGFFVPFAVGIFVLDDLCAAGHSLLERGSMRSS